MTWRPSKWSSFYKGLSAFEGRCFLRHRNRAKCNLTLWIIVFLKKGNGRHGMLINLMLFQSFWYLFEKVTSKASRNDRVYKGLLPAILRLRKPCFYQGIIRVSGNGDSPQGMLINTMLFQRVCYLFVKVASKVSINDRFYKVSGRCFSNVAKRCFSNDFLAFRRAT